MVKIMMFSQRIPLGAANSGRRSESWTHRGQLRTRRLSRLSRRSRPSCHEFCALSGLIALSAPCPDSDRPRQDAGAQRLWALPQSVRGRQRSTGRGCRGDLNGLELAQSLACHHRLGHDVAAAVPVEEGHEHHDERSGYQDPRPQSRRHLTVGDQSGM